MIRKERVRVRNSVLAPSAIRLIRASIPNHAEVWDDVLDHIRAEIAYYVAKELPWCDDDIASALTGAIYKKVWRYEQIKVSENNSFIIVEFLLRNLTSPRRTVDEYCPYFKSMLWTEYEDCKYQANMGSSLRP